MRCVEASLKLRAAEYSGERERVARSLRAKCTPDSPPRANFNDTQEAMKYSEGYRDRETERERKRNARGYTLQNKPIF